MRWHGIMCFKPYESIAIPEKNLFASKLNEVAVEIVVTNENIVRKIVLKMMYV